MTENVVIVERTFNATKKLVWRALTEKELMKLWYFNLEEFNPAVGFKFEFIGGPEDGVQYKHLCEITEVIFEKKLSYSWKYEGYEGISYVTFELFEENENTRLKLTHTGIDTFPGSITDFAIHNFKEGWNHIINISLKDFLEKNNH
jgi:uncharacterized protein YndB with AHSA1/START domain